MKKLEICGITFEVIIPRKPITDFTEKTRFRGLEYYYGKPSQSKISIYNGWHDWKHEVDRSDFGFVENFGVSSANGFQFTITFRLYWFNRIYVGFITRDHNRLYLLQ